MRIRIPPRGTRAVALLLPAVVGVVGAWLGIQLFGNETTRMGPFTVDLSSRFGDGRMVIALPPLGEVRLDTHDSPLDVRATLTDVDIEQLASDLEERSTAEIADEVESDARARFRGYAARVLVVAILGASIAGLVVYRRRWRAIAASAVTAAVLVGGSEAIAWRTFRQEAFAEPTFAGTLRLAPQLLGPVEELTQRLDELRTNLERIVGGAIKAYSALEPQTIGGREGLRVLHISDIHLNTLGLDFAVELARGFDVDLVIDTGDLTSYGTPVEEAIVSQIPRFRRPYAFVRGNHDPPEVGELVERTRNGSTLDGSLRTVGGLDIYGVAHPVFTEDQQEEADTDALAAGAREIGPRIARDVEALKDEPDIVAVHDDRMAEELAGRVPVVLSGHYHRARATTVDGTLFLRAGSTGGAGVNMFRQAGSPVPLSATILYFDDKQELIAYDLVEQSPTTGRLTIQRHLVSEAPEPSPSPILSPTAMAGPEA